MSLKKFEETIEHLKTRWKDTDRDFLRQLFPLLADGRPISLTHLAEITHKDIATVEQELTKGYTGRDSDGNVIELFGVMHTPTLHRIQLGQVCLFSCCALVAHMVPLLLDQMATIESVDPISHRLVRLHVASSGVQVVDPQTVGTLVVTTQEQVLKEVRSAFCEHVCYFPDEGTAEEFIAADSRRYRVDIHQFHEAACKLKSALWG